MTKMWIYAHISIRKYEIKGQPRLRVNGFAMRPKHPNKNDTQELAVDKFDFEKG